MFSQEDTKVFDLPNSYEKLDAMGEMYFPQLGALLVKANGLINEIYGVEPNALYKVTQAPMASKGRREDATFSDKRNNVEEINVGLRAKGQPTNLTKPNGAPCQMHFAALYFAMVNLRGDYGLSVCFQPYLLTYHQKHRDDFAHWISKLSLESIFDTVGVHLNSNVKAATISESLRSPKSVLTVPVQSGIDPSKHELVKLVIMFAGMFPLLDVFTQLCNNIDVMHRRDPQLFKAWWYSGKARNYIETFAVEPLKSESSKVSEDRVRTYFEAFLGRKFPTTRPPWLKSKKSKSNLELDGYCPDLNLAFEYQGEYHYFYVPVHHRLRSLEDVQKNDALKLELCKQQGVDLIQVPYWERDNSSFVINALRSLERSEINALLS